MNFERDRLGYAFEDDYPESYDPGDLHRLRAILAHQVARLGSAGPDVDTRLVGVLMGRRCANHNTRPQIEIRDRRDGTVSLLARGEVLVPAADAAAIRQYFAGYDELHPRHTGRRTGYLRFRPAPAAPSDQDRKIDECAAAGVTAWPNYLATMAPVSKGLGSPEPVAPPSGLDRSGGAAITVAVIDTGIAAAERTDPWLRVERTGGNTDELDALPAGPDGLLDYAAGHGTFVSGIVQRVAPQARIRMYRAADTDGFATDNDIAAAILQAHDDGAQIINLSLGFRTADDAPPPAIADAVATVQAESGGETVIVAAAGNFGDRSVVYPAALPGVEAVAGLTAHLTPAGWSSYGDAVAFSTVAEGVRSTYVSGRESPVFDPAPDTFPIAGSDEPWALWTGTSFAAPQIAGAVARISYVEGIAPREAVRKLAEYGKPINGFGKAMRILKGID